MNFRLFFSKKSYNFAQNKTKLFMNYTILFFVLLGLFLFFSLLSVLENSKAFAILDYN